MPLGAIRFDGHGPGYSTFEYGESQAHSKTGTTATLSRFLPPVERLSYHSGPLEPFPPVGGYTFHLALEFGPSRV